MTGGQKVAVIAVLAVFALVMFNLSIWRRMRAALAAARAENEAERASLDPTADDYPPR